MSCPRAAERRGACATAAATAAYTALLTGKFPDPVTITLPKGETPAFALATEHLADGTATAGSDYVARSGTITFAAGETQKTISVTVNGDKVAELNETLALRLSSPSGATIADGAAVVLSPKTTAIISFSLCGFANLSSIAILLGGLGGMAPTRRKDIARFGLLAVMAGTLSNLMSGTIAGLFVAMG